MGNLFPILRSQEQLSLSASKVHKFVCTVIRTVELYAWTILRTGGIDSFKLRNQEGNKSENLAEKQKFCFDLTQSKKISNDQELIQSDPISCPQNQKGNN